MQQAHGNGRSGRQPPVYLDYQASTPVDPRVLEAMLPWYREHFGNPHSVHHRYGRDAAHALDRARAEIAALIGARAHEIVLCSGATEANNLALRGTVAADRSRRHIVSCVTEHRSVLEVARALADEGCELELLPVRSDGLVDLDVLQRALRDDTLLVSVMSVNNEIGVIQPLAEIGALCASRGVLLHTDAAQAAGRLALDVEAMRISLLSLSGHKLYAPQGIGALFVRDDPAVTLRGQMLGGGQQYGLRAGTVPVALAVALGRACAIAAEELSVESPRLRRLSERLLDGLSAALPDVQLLGHPRIRVAGSLYLAFAGVDAEALVLATPELAFSTGSACGSATPEPSHVVRALGADDDVAHSAVRLSFGRFTTETEIDFALSTLVRAVRDLRTAR